MKSNAKTFVVTDEVECKTWVRCIQNCGRDHWTHTQTDRRPGFQYTQFLKHQLTTNNSTRVKKRHNLYNTVRYSKNKTKQTQVNLQSRNTYRHDNLPSESDDNKDEQTDK